MDGALIGLTAMMRTVELSAMTKDRFAILVVDDDADARSNMLDILADRGYRVSIASDSGTALAVVEQQNHDLAVVDWGLRGMDGLALCGELMRRRPAMATLLIMGYADPVSPAAVREVGVRQVFRKPLDVRKLLAAIDAALVP